MNKNKLTYHFDDFTLQAYSNILERALELYRFTTYEELDKQKSFLLWRHDCDTSLESALALAEIEASKGIVATYFLMLHCEHYYVLEYHSSQIVKKIISLGHKVGLHFDPFYYGIDDEKLLDMHIAYEKNILEHFFTIQ